jgi:hypothetical protein
MESIKTVAKFYTKLKILIAPDMLEIGMYLYSPRLEAVFKVVRIHYNLGVPTSLTVRRAIANHPGLIGDITQWTHVYPKAIKLLPSKAMTVTEAIRCVEMPVH